MSAVVDTHTAVWYLSRSPDLSSAALALLNETAQAGDPVYLPAISFVEVIYLVEKGRLSPAALEHLNDAVADPQAIFELVPLDLAVARSVRQIPRDLVPDMPDRIIAATALRLGLPLVTRDQRIRALGIETVW